MNDGNFAAFEKLGERMSDPDALTRKVLDSINHLYFGDGDERRATYEYPGFINIPESYINDDTDGSKRAWAVGPDLAEDGVWTGNLMDEHGDLAVPLMTFAVYPNSDNPDYIAMAVYTHGIGDWYVGGGCSDANCPRKDRR